MNRIYWEPGKVNVRALRNSLSTSCEVEGFPATIVNKGEIKFGKSFRYGFGNSAVVVNEYTDGSGNIEVIGENPGILEKILGIEQIR